MSLLNRLHPSHVEGRLPGFDGATGWLNSEPLTPDGLRGKVVLVDFWTYTCINWLRTLGYVRAWAEKYAGRGLVVVGVHTPEFPFERDVDNVRWAVQADGIEYPVALDSRYGVWQAFSNHYWPAVYIADAEGRIRHHHFGEGGYEECERVVQQLLREAGRDDVGDDLVSVADDGFQAQADYANLRSPESYLGYEQGHQLCVAGSAGARRVARVRRSPRPPAQPVGARRKVGDRAEGERPQRRGGTSRVSVPCARRQPRARPAGARDDVSAVPGDRRRRAARRRARLRHR